MLVLIMHAESGLGWLLFRSPSGRERYPFEADTEEKFNTLLMEAGQVFPWGFHTYPQLAVDMDLMY